MIYGVLFLYEAIVCSFVDKLNYTEARGMFLAKGKLYIYPRKIFYFAMVQIPLILVMGLRYKIGVDYPNYEYIFSRIRLSGDTCNMEKGYYLLNKLIGMISDNAQILFFIVSVIINVLFVKAIVNNGGELYWGILAFLGLGYYFYAMNIQRQYIAIGIIFYGFTFFERRELKKFIGCVLLASTFHTSSLIWLAVYPLVHFLRGGYYGISFVLIGGVTVLREVVLGLLIKLNFYKKQIMGVRVLIGTGYFSAINTVICGVFLCVCLILYKRLITLRKQNDVRIKILWLMFLTQIFLWKFGGAASRINAYFCPMYLLLLSDIVKCFSPNIQRILKIILGMFLCLAMYIILNYSGNAGHHFLPYRYRLFGA